MPTNVKPTNWVMVGCLTFAVHLWCGQILPK